MIDYYTRMLAKTGDQNYQKLIDLMTKQKKEPEGVSRWLKQ